MNQFIRFVLPPVRGGVYADVWKGDISGLWNVDIIYWGDIAMRRQFGCWRQAMDWVDDVMRIQI